MSTDYLDQRAFANNNPVNNDDPTGDASSSLTVKTQYMGCGKTEFGSDDGIVVGNLQCFCSGDLKSEIRWQAGFSTEGIVPVSTPVENYGTQFYGSLGAPYLQRSSPKVWTAYPDYGFHGTIGPFYTGIHYVFETSLGGEVDGDYLHVSVTIPFELGRHYGNPFIDLGEIAGGDLFLSVTTQSSSQSLCFTN